MDRLASFSAIILDAALKATLLLALAWAGGLLLKHRSAAARHMVRAFILVALLLLPFSGLLPGWRVRGIPTFSVAPSVTQPAAQPAAAQALSTTPFAGEPQIVRGKEPSAHPAASQAKTRAGQEAVQNQTSSASAAIPTSPAYAPGEAELKTRATVNWLSGLVMAWLVGSGFFGLRWATSVARLRRLVRGAAPVGDPEWNAEARVIARSLQLRREIALLESKETDVPLAAGILCPKVVLPPDYSEWSEVRRSAVLQHEIAHIKRLDALTHIVAQAATVLYWFHPLAWLTVRAMRSERERACDDQVLAAGTKASEYAHELLDIVSNLRRPALAGALAMARRSQLEGRVLAVLDPGLRRGAVSHRASLAAAVVVLGVALPIAALRPAQQASTSSAPPARAQSAQVSTPAIAPHVSSGPAYAATPGNAFAIDSDTQPAIASTSPAIADAAAPAVSAFSASPAAPAARGGGDMTVCGSKAKLHNMSINSHDGHQSWTASWSGDDCSVELRTEGDIQFNAEATDIQSISSGGYFEVNVREGASLRQVRITPSGNGMQYMLKVNGKEAPFDSEAKTWFASFLLSLERATGFAADVRVPKLLAKGGPTAVLDEINNLQGDYVRGIYFRKLLDQPNLPSAVVVRVINQSGQQIESDYEKARVLMEVSQQYELADETSRTAFLGAAGKLSSDYEHARVLMALLKRPNISTTNVRAALDSASTIKSDYEKSRILLSLIEQKSFEHSYLDSYLKLVANITSDYEKSRDLLAPLQRYTLTSAQVDQIIDAATRMSSDYEKARLITTMASAGKFDENQMSNYLKVVASINSDYERARCLTTLMDRNKLSDASLVKTIDATSHIQSDYEKARVLVAVAGKYQLQGALRESYIKAAESINSESERNRALAGVVRRATL
jgi:beta-lactamase regulating signal transducer with metallopeptidase domain